MATMTNRAFQEVKGRHQCPGTGSSINGWPAQSFAVLVGMPLVLGEGFAIANLAIPAPWPGILARMQLSHLDESTSGTQLGHSSRRKRSPKTRPPNRFSRLQRASSLSDPPSFPLHSPLHLSDTRLSGSTTPIFSPFTFHRPPSTVRYSGFLLDTSLLCTELLLAQKRDNLLNNSHSHKLRKHEDHHTRCPCWRPRCLRHGLPIPRHTRYDRDTDHCQGKWCVPIHAPDAIDLN
jgi:hypothetical protein